MTLPSYPYLKARYNPPLMMSLFLTKLYKELEL